jgi:hypothetical protein
MAGGLHRIEKCSGLQLAHFPELYKFPNLWSMKYVRFALRCIESPGHWGQFHWFKLIYIYDIPAFCIPTTNLFQLCLGRTSPYSSIPSVYSDYSSKIRSRVVPYSISRLILIQLTHFSWYFHVPWFVSPVLTELLHCSEILIAPTLRARKVNEVFLFLLVIHCDDGSIQHFEVITEMCARSIFSSPAAVINVSIQHHRTTSAFIRRLEIYPRRVSWQNRRAILSTRGENSWRERKLRVAWYGRDLWELGVRGARLVLFERSHVLKSRTRRYSTILPDNDIMNFKSKGRSLFKIGVIHVSYLRDSSLQQQDRR